MSVWALVFGILSLTTLVVGAVGLFGSTTAGARPRAVRTDDPLRRAAVRDPHGPRGRD
jgi:hypothetical protein